MDKVEFNSQVWFSHVQLNTIFGDAPNGMAFGSNIYANQAVSSDNGYPAYLHRPYTMKIPYKLPESLHTSTKQPSVPQLYRWNGSTWVLQPDAVVNYDADHITASVQQLGKWAVMIPETNRPTYTNYLPTINRSSLVDLSITHIEVTQATQTMDNRVPLVAQRPTIARIYATTTDPGATAGVYLTLEGYRNGQPLPGSPLKVGPWAIYREQQRGSFGYTTNLPLPLEWIQGKIELVAWIDTAAAVTESNEANNGYWVPVGFNDVPPLQLMLVPVAYSELSTGRFFPAPSKDEVSDWVMRSYPLHQVNVSWHAPLSFQGDLGKNEEWTRLLGQVTSLKQSEGAPQSQVYYGLIPVRNENGESPSLHWGGVGWVGRRASIGVSYSGSTAAHELGHNFGLLHAPCGAGLYLDETYPYFNASIGEYGVNVWQMQIFSPDIYRDVMSYCSPEWFSDYNYVKLFRDQMEKGRAVRSDRSEEVGTGLLIRADLTNEATLLPIYELSDVTLSADAEDPNRTYAVELLDRNGVSLSRHGVEVISAEEHGHIAHYINTLIPFPSNGDLSLVRLLQGEQIIAERGFHPVEAVERSAPDINQTETAWTFTWDAADTPVLVRYRSDRNPGWIVLALDWTGGELDIDPQRLSGGFIDFDLVYADSRQPRSRSKPPSLLLPNQTPTVWIRGEDEIQAGGFLYLQGHAYDPEDGILTLGQWLLDDVPMGNQPILELNRLSVGEHTILLRAVDSQGQVAEAVHRVMVNP